MKKLSSLAALLIALNLSGASVAYANNQGKTGKTAEPSYIEQAIAKLPAKDAAQFRDTMKQAHEKNMAIADQIHSLHDDIDVIVGAEQFDRDAFLAKSKQLRDVYETMRSNTDDAFATAVSQLPQDERKTLADAMAYPHEKHKAAAGNAQ